MATTVCASLRRGMGVVLVVGSLPLVARSGTVADEGRIVPGSVHVAHWLETSIWVDPVLIVLATTCLTLGVVSLLTTVERQEWIVYVACLLPPVLLLSASIVVAVAGLLGHHFNVTRWAPQ